MTDGREGKGPTACDCTAQSGLCLAACCDSVRTKEITQNIVSLLRLEQFANAPAWSAFAEAPMNLIAESQNEMLSRRVYRWFAETQAVDTLWRLDGGRDPRRSRRTECRWGMS